MPRELRATRRQGERVLAAVRKMFKGWIQSGDTGPNLIMDWDWLGYGPQVSIVWEEGPYDWAMLFPHGGVEEEFGFTLKPVTLPKGIWTEPITSFAIAIIRDPS
jgi:hypothetical protein